MYDFCSGHHPCDREPPFSFLYNSNNNEQPPPPYIGGPPLLPCPSPAAQAEDPSPHEFRGNCRGVWIYFCYNHMNSYVLNNHPPYTDPYRPPSPCMACRRPTTPPQQDNTHKPPVLHDDSKKKVENFTDNKPTVRVYCKAKTDYSLTIRDGSVILAPSNPNDPYQHWIKDEKFGINVRDEQGYPSFALINKATGQAMKHSIGVKYPVQLTEYNPEKLDISLLWSKGKNLSLRAVDNIQLNVDAFEGIPEYGGVKDGTRIFLWDWVDGDNQKWTIVSYSKTPTKKPKRGVIPKRPIKGVSIFLHD